MERLSTTDALTQLHNRLKIERILETLQTRYESNQRLYTILFIDIDFSKASTTPSAITPAIWC